jgi:exodeoxyribonuclease VII large subunit
VPLETSAESPVPVRTVLNLVSGWIGRLGRVWVEGQIAEATRRGNTVFLTLRDPVAAVSVRVIASRLVFEATDPQVGARVVVHAKPDFNAARGSFALTALEVRAVGIGELPPQPFQPRQQHRSPPPAPRARSARTSRGWR